MALKKKRKAKRVSGKAKASTRAKVVARKVKPRGAKKSFRARSRGQYRGK